LAHFSTFGFARGPIEATSPVGVCKSLIEDHRGDNYQAVYTVRFASRINALHASQKKSKRGIATPRRELELIRERLKWVERPHNGKADETRV
jgi:phage-related protein